MKILKELTDAKLIIIFVSDEKDWSSKTDAEYEAHFKSLKTSDSMVVTHAVVGDSPSGCTSPTGTWTRADYGEGYIEVSALMGGEFVSICSSVRFSMSFTITMGNLP
mgnify:CR=1 FL=1